MFSAENTIFKRVYQNPLYIDGKWDDYDAIITQDRLKQRLIRMSNDAYIPLSQIEKIEEGEKINERDCFIATAVYGSSDSLQVRTLREFRDNVLMRNPAGRPLVDFYYSGAGKRTADFIREHLSPAIPIIRRGLDVLVERYTAQIK